MAQETNEGGAEYEPGAGFDKRTLTDKVYESLREDILTNRLPPGEALQEAGIARSLGVSRGPVREALRKLASEGLVNLEPRRGASVSSLSREEFLDAYRVREALEVLAIQLATPRLEDADLERLTKLHDDMLEAAEEEGVERFFRSNSEFHTLFVDRSGNLMLQDMFYPLMDQMRRYRLRSMNLRGGLMRSCEEHKAIIEAVKARDAQRAAELLRDHIRVPQRILESSKEEGELELAVQTG